MFDHVTIRVSDREASQLVAPHAGFALADDTADRARFAGRSRSFSVVAGPPSEHAHLAFPAAVDRFHAALTGAGHRDNGGPGERSEYHPGYYGAYVLDPDGNNVELVTHNR